MNSETRVVKEKDIAEAMHQQSSRHLSLIDRRDLWHLVENAYRNTAISASKACELIGVPLGHARHILEEWEKTKANCCEDPELESVLISMLDVEAARLLAEIEVEPIEMVSVFKIETHEFAASVLKKLAKSIRISGLRK